MNDALIIKYGEIALRGKNRRLFEDKLIATIKKSLRGLAGYTVYKENGRFLIKRADLETERDLPFDADALIKRVKNIPGLIGVCPCAVTEDRSLENLQSAALGYMRGLSTAAASFKVETKRGDKSYPYESPFISSEIGGYILENTDNFTVNVREPDVVLTVEIRNNAYFYTEEVKCPGGLPVGSSGKGMALISAGIDSPVAAYMAARRGVLIEAVYFHSPPYTSERALQKVKDVCERIGAYNGPVKLHAVPFTETQLKLRDRTPPEKLTILLKRSMLRIAETLARANGCDVLVTGDSIGQVASQTLKSIEAVSSAASMPVIRPLACFDKDDIIKLAREIGTYEISIRPFDDCCTLFVAKHPETKPKASIIESIERNIPELKELEERAAADAAAYVV